MRALVLTLVLAFGVAAPATAAERFPAVIPLPPGFQPEGIAGGPGTTFYVGSIPTGAVWVGSARTGTVRPLVEPRDGRAAIGLELDRHGRLFVAGGPTGRAFVYEAATGEDLGAYDLATAPTFVNDVVVTRRAAYFTDSQRQVLHVLRLGPRGALPSAAETLPLTGDLQYDDDPSTFELNGIAATRGGRTLFTVQSSTGKLFRVDARTGSTDEVRLRGGDLANGDGLLLRGRTLYAVQNQLNRIAVVRLSRSGRSGRIVAHVEDPDFDVPTTIAVVAGRLYAVNARFGTPPTPSTPYSVVRVDGR
jgi:sugar lactone lactonase YvrE